MDVSRIYTNQTFHESIGLIVFIGQREGVQLWKVGVFLYNLSAELNGTWGASCAVTGLKSNLQKLCMLVVQDGAMFCEYFVDRSISVILLFNFSPFVLLDLKVCVYEFCFWFFSFFFFLPKWKDIHMLSVIVSLYILCRLCGERDPISTSIFCFPKLGDETYQLVGDFQGIFDVKENTT